MQPVITIQWTGVEVVAKKSHWYKRKIHEAATIIVSDAIISQPSVEIPRIWHPLLKEQEEEIKREKISRKIKEIERQKVVEQEQRRMEESRSPDKKNGSTVDTRLQVNLRQRKLTSCYKPRHQKKYSLRSVTSRPARLIEEW
jgi:hypothetical protein